MGNKDFLESAKKSFDRRTKPSNQGKENRRKRDRYFDPVAKVIWEFENITGIKIEDLDVSTKEGTRQRAELLVLLKDYAGLTYKEISEFYVFEDIRMNSLRSIYRNAKKRGRKN